MQTISTHVGIDVSKAKLDVILLREEKQLHAVFENTSTGWKKLQKWLKRHGCSQVHVCLEATGHYGDGIAEVLYAGGSRVSVVNPARIKAFASSRLSRQKTDKADAQLIALFCRSQLPDAWTPPDPAQHELRAMVRHLQDLKDIRQQQLNRLGASFSSPTVACSLQAHITFLEQQMSALEQLIADHIERHPTLKEQHTLLDTIPGLGTTTIATLLAEVPDIRAFDTAPQLAAYAGVTPRHHQSGSSVRRPTHISKQGNARLRTALYFPAMVAMRHNPLLRTFAERLRSTGHAPKSIIVAVIRKLLHLVFGILKSGKPFDPHYPTQTALAS